MDTDFEYGGGGPSTFSDGGVLAVKKLTTSWTDRQWVKFGTIISRSQVLLL